MPAAPRREQRRMSQRESRQRGMPTKCFAASFGGNAAFQTPAPTAVGDDFVTAAVLRPPSLTRHSLHGEEILLARDLSKNRQPLRPGTLFRIVLSRKMPQHILQD